MLKPQVNPLIPADTARVAYAAFPRGNRYIVLRDELGTIFQDKMFVDLFPKAGQPAETPWRLALVTVVQFAEGLSDRRVADAVRGRIDLKYLLGLELDDPGFHYSILSRFRSRLIEGNEEHLLLDILTKKCQQVKLLKARGKARTDATHILAGVRRLNRIEVIGETLRMTLNRLATVAPEWLREQVEEDWYKRYAKRFEKEKMPRTLEKETVFAQQIGRDGFDLLQAVYSANAPAHLKDMPEVDVLRRCWIGQFWIESGEVRWREKGNLQPAAHRLDSPYDPEAHYGKKGTFDWVGYKVHFTETCDDDLPHLITHVDTTEPVVADTVRVEPIHQALSAKGYLPAEHLVDGNYINSALVVESQKRFGVELVGPLKPNPHRRQTESGFDISNFTIDWDNRVATCPEGKTSINWWSKWYDGKEVVNIKFSRTDCRQCPVHELCTKNARRNPRKLHLKPREQHEVIERNRTERETPEWKTRYNRRAGVEGTFSQGVRSQGLRRNRYIGLKKNHLQNTAIASAINFQRLADWFEDIEREQTRVSSFARLQV